MHFRQTKDEPPTVGLTSLIDVVFLLLIFFMVSTTFEQQGDIRVKLPEASDSAPVIPHMIEIAVDANDRYYLGGQAISDPQKTNLRYLLVRHEAERSTPVRIRADAEASHQAVVTVMDLLAGSGFNKVGLATLDRERQAGD